MNLEALTLAHEIAKHIIKSIRKYLPELNDEQCLEIGKTIVTANFEKCLKTKLKRDE